MAKRKRLRHQKFPHANTGVTLPQSGIHPQPRWQPSVILHPTTSPPRAKRGVACAHAKHKNDYLLALPSAIKPTLADRFYALPQELRNHIFAYLLIRPAKWDIEHALECPLRSSNANITPELAMFQDAYAECCPGMWRLPERHRHIWVSPWRSQWAPEQLNAYLCTKCYDKRWRPRPFPIAKLLPCLCARRSNLQTMLVCKRWYHEAAQVFYTENTFAFEDSTTFVDFVKNLNPAKRSLISKVSLMALEDPAQTQPGANIAPNANFDELMSGWESSKRVQHIWSQLRLLPSLSELELDSLFLTRVRTLTLMLRLGLGNLRAVRFVLRAPNEVAGQFGNATVWPIFAARALLQGDVAEVVARAIKGQRRKKDMKKPGDLVNEFNRISAED